MIKAETCEAFDQRQIASQIGKAAELGLEFSDELMPGNRRKGRFESGMVSRFATAVKPFQRQDLAPLDGARVDVGFPVHLARGGSVHLRDVFLFLKSRTSSL